MDYEKYLKDCPNEEAFLFEDGTRVRSLDELYNYLESKGSDVFEKHVNDDCNDFYHWIKDVIGDNTFAERIEFTRKYDLFLKKLNHRIKYIENRLNYMDDERNNGEDVQNNSGGYDSRPEEYGLAVEYIQSGLKDFLLGLIIGIVLGVVILQMV